MFDRALNVFERSDFRRVTNRSPIKDVPDNKLCLSTCNIQADFHRFIKAAAEKEGKKKVHFSNTCKWIVMDV